MARQKEHRDEPLTEPTPARVSPPYEAWADVPWRSIIASIGLVAAALLLTAVVYLAINVLPERIRINTVYNDGTLSEILRGYGMEEKRMKELSIINGMELTERVQRGTLIKTIVK